MAYLTLNPFGTGPATQIVETGGPTTLDITTIPDGDVLTRSGNTIIGTAPSTITVGAPTAATANALALTGNVLSSTPADATHPGHVTTGSQVIAGSKNFTTVLDTPGLTNTTGASTATIKGSASTGFNAVGVVLDNTTALVSTGDKLLSVRNAGGEQLAVSQLGEIFAPNQATLSGNSVSTGTAFGVILDNRTAFVTAGDRLVSVRNAGAEKLLIDKDGNIGSNGPQTITAGGKVQLNTIQGQFAFGSVGDGVLSIGGSNKSLALWGNRTAGDSGIDIILNSTVTRTAGKLLSVQNNAAEKLSVDFNGVINGPGITYSAGNLLLSTTATNADIVIKGSATAGDSSSDVYVDTTNTRTAGSLLALRNNTVEKLTVDYNGTIRGSTAQHLPVSVIGSTLTNGSSVGVILDNSTSLTTNGDKTVSIRNAGSEVAYCDLNGQFVSNQGFKGPTLSVNTWQPLNTTNLLINGNATNISTAAILDIDNTINLTVAGAKLLRLNNNEIEKLAIDKDGVVLAPSTLTIKGSAATTGTAVGVVLDNTVNLTTAGDKLLSVRNATVEKASVDKDAKLSLIGPGTMTLVPGGTGTATLTTNGANDFWAFTGTNFAPTFSSGSLIDVNGVTAINTGVLSLKGRAATTGTSVGVILDNTVNLTTAGDNILSVRNAGVEKLHIDKDGNIITNSTQNFTAGGAIQLSTSLGQFNFGGAGDGILLIQGTNKFLTFLGHRNAADTGSDVVIGTVATRTAGKLLDIQNNTVSKLAIDFNGKSIYPTGGAADVAGIATLTSGTVTISTTAVTANSVIMLTYRTPSGSAQGGKLAAPAANITAGTSFVVNAVDLSGTTVTSDTSTFSWFIIN